MEEYVRQAKAAGHGIPDQMPGWPTWDAGSAPDLTDETGVTPAVLSISSPDVHVGDDTQANELADRTNYPGYSRGTWRGSRSAVWL